MNLDKLFTQALVTLTFGKGQAPPEFATPPHRSKRPPETEARADAKRLRKARRGW